MKDIDFDELDRAVNSLIGPDTNTPTTTTSPATPTAPAPNAAAPTAPPLAERRSSGRFMDVVHPSSDMRTSAVPPRPVSREAVTIATPAPSTTPDAPTVDTKPATAWPDPIDFHAEKSEPTSAPSSEPTAPAPSEMTSPLESPFLSDAKVEKRPLGAFSDEVHESAPTLPAPTPDSAPELQTQDIPGGLDDKPKNSDHPVENDTPMPAELQAGLLSIEANESTESVKAESAPADQEPVGPTSITQQYTEQPSTGDQPVNNVFNTEAYKKPQGGSKKKKSGLLVVLWIFLLLVVGAGVGAAVYFFVLPRL